jgi:hypothetical protein
VSARLTPAAVKVPFKNVDAAEVPPCAVMQVTGSVIEDGVAFLTCSQVGTTLGTQFAINGLVRVAAGQKGVCYRQGDVQAAFDQGSPAAGEGWGPRANQWTLARGYPGLITVHAVKSAAGKILYGVAAAPTAVVGRCANEVEAIDDGEPGSGTFVVYVWDGSDFVASDPAMEFTGYNASAAPIPPDALVPFVAVDGLWVAAAAPGSGGVRLFRAQLDGALASADTSTAVHNIGSLTGATAPEITSASNPFALAGLDGDECLLVEDASSATPTYFIAQVEHHECP